MADDEPLGRDYLLHEQLGQGATGIVRRATRNDGGPPLAAKLLRADLAGNRRVRDLFLREEAALRSLQHESIVAIRELIFERGQLALLMELVDGPNLRGYLAERGGTLPPDEACSIAAQAAAGLAAAHAQGVVHLDLKPENILFADGTPPPRIKITDFGVAALLLDAGRDRESLGGTPGYIAPEVLDGGTPTAAADVFALGVVLVEMLTGGRPDPRGADPPTSLPEELRTVVRECLALDPRDRPTARTVAARLRMAPSSVTGFSAHAPTAPPGPQEATRLRDRARGPEPEAAGEPPAAGRKLKAPVVTLLAGLALALVLLGLSVKAAARPDIVVNPPAPTPSAVSPTAPAAAPWVTHIPQNRRDPALLTGRITQNGTTFLLFDQLTLRADGTLVNQNRQLYAIPLAPQVTVQFSRRPPGQVSATDVSRLVDTGRFERSPFTLHYDGKDRIDKIEEFCRNSAGKHVACAS